METQMVEVIFGDITFLETEMDGMYKAIINRIDKIEKYDMDDLDYKCEEGLKTYESYLIPSEYKGEIIFPENTINL
jgi:hypothetical protein